MENNSVTEKSLVVRALWALTIQVPSLTRFLSCEIQCWGKNITQLSHRSLKVWIPSDSTAHVQEVLKEASSLPLNVRLRDSVVLTVGSILSLIPDQPLRAMMFCIFSVCCRRNSWFWFAIIKLTALFKPLFRVMWAFETVFLAGKQGRQPVDCWWYTLSTLQPSVGKLKSPKSKVNGSYSKSCFSAIPQCVSLVLSPFVCAAAQLCSWQERHHCSFSPSP